MHIRRHIACHPYNMLHEWHQERSAQRESHAAYFPVCAPRGRSWPFVAKLPRNIFAAYLKPCLQRAAGINDSCPCILRSRSAARRQGLPSPVPGGMRREPRGPGTSMAFWQNLSMSIAPGLERRSLSTQVGIPSETPRAFSTVSRLRVPIVRPDRSRDIASVSWYIASRTRVTHSVSAGGGSKGNCNPARPPTFLTHPPILHNARQSTTTPSPDVNSYNPMSFPSPERKQEMPRKARMKAFIHFLEAEQVSPVAGAQPTRKR